jgi:hypothetical protein
MTEVKPVAIISDRPETREKSEGFGFSAYIKTIADLIAYKAPPL